jgi:hypothetical protein
MVEWRAFRKAMCESSMDKSRCSFRLRDVLNPDRIDLIRAINADLVVEGQIQYLSEGSRSEEEFAIIDVEGINSPVIVPTNLISVRPAEPRAACSQIAAGKEQPDRDRDEKSRR